SMRIADREQATRNRDRIIHDPALADSPIVDVAAEIAWRDRIDDIRFLRRHPHHAKMRPDRNAHVLQDIVVFLDARVINRHARIIDSLVDDAERIGLWCPAEIVDSLSPISLTTGVDFIDRADLAWLRFRNQILILEAPPRRRIAAE